jgi:hypothetical protein
VGAGAAGIPRPVVTVCLLSLSFAFAPGPTPVGYWNSRIGLTTSAVTVNSM